MGLALRKSVYYGRRDNDGGLKTVVEIPFDLGKCPDDSLSCIFDGRIARGIINRKFSVAR